MNPELNPEQSPTAEAQHQPGIFEKINNAARTRLAIAGIALSAAVSGAELSRSNEADAAPAPAATTSSLKETCVQAGLARPEVEEATIFHAGKYLRQINIFQGRFPEMPEVCDGKFKLQAAGMFQAKSRGHKAWHNLGYWNSIQGVQRGDSGLPANYSDYPSSHEPRNSDMYIKRGDRARFLEKSKIVNENGKVVADKIYAIKAKISREPGHVVLSSLGER